MAAGKNQTWHMILGFAIILLPIAVLGFGIDKLVAWLGGNGELKVTVAADFQPDLQDPNKTALRISGSAWLQEKPAENGVAWVEVVRKDPPLKFTLPAQVISGRFKVEADSALRAIAVSDTFEIDVRVAVPTAEGETVTGSAKAQYSGHFTLDIPPYAWIAGIVVLFLYLATIYTGSVSSFKNRLQVGTAYVVIAFALILPTTAPFALIYYPRFLDKVAQSPVGILRVQNVNITGNKEPLALNQWVIHIGGIPEKVSVPDSVPETDEAAKLVGAPALYDLQGGIVVPLYVIILALLGGAVSMTRAIPRLQNDLDETVNRFKVLQTFEAVGGLAAGFGRSLPIVRARQELTKPDGPEDASAEAGRVELEAAGEATDADIVPDVGGETRTEMPSKAEGGGTILNAGEQQESEIPDGTITETGTGESEGTDEITGADGVPGAGGRTGAEQPGAAQGSGESIEDLKKKLLELRKELIVQYMYLIIAPVLAVVSYYLLSMMEERLIQSVPIVVLIAFASGLLSETVLGTISEKAEGYLKRLKESSKQSRLPQGQPSDPIPRDAASPGIEPTT